MIDPFGAITFAYEVVTRGWDWYSTREAPFRTEAFIKEHSDCVRRCIDAVTAVDRLSADDLAAGSRAVLTMIASVAQSLRPGDDVNANYMIPVVPSDALLKRTLFVDRRLTPGAFQCLLSLQMWAKEVQGFPEEFVLPVEKADGGHRSLLFGAPEAYVENRVCFVRDTLRLRSQLKAIDQPQIRQEVQRYFDEHQKRVRSFASYPVEDPDGPRVIAVVNVQSVKRAITGVSAGNQRRLTIAIAPLLRGLAYFIRRRHSKEIAAGMQPNPQGTV